MDPHFIFAHVSRTLRSEDGLSNTTRLTTIDSNALDNLYPALVECFGIILLGFIAGKFNFINDVEAKGLGTFVGTFSLPALIFVSLCQLNLTSVNWIFLAAVAIAKSIVFLIVLSIGAFSSGSNPSSSALFAIFCTQSNDFALGFPVLSAIYGTTNPDYPMYLYLLAPISLALLNPIGFIILEIGKSRRENQENRSNWKIFKKVTKSILTNPLILMTFLGILGNLVFHSVMPHIIHDFMRTLGSAFSASALFLLGLRMVGGQSGSPTGPKYVILPFLLIVIKSLVLPLITREIISQMNSGHNATETENLSNYGFLYGTIPTAPSVFVYSTTYGIESDMIAGAITASTFIAAPLMYVSAKLLMIRNLDPSDYIEEIDLFILDISIIGLIAAMWVIFVLVASRRAYAIPHQITLVLTVTQGVACFGAILWSFFDCRHGWRLYVQFILFGYGVFGSRICTAVLSITLLLQSMSTSLAVKYRKLLVGISLILPLMIVAGLTVFVAVETEAHGEKVDPNFQYGKTQAITALIVLIFSFLVTVISLIFEHRNTLSKKGSEPERERLLSSPLSTSSEENAPVCEGSTDGQPCSGPPMSDIEDMGNAPTQRCQTGNGTRRYRCDSTHREYCSGLIRRYEVPPAEDALSPDNVLGVNAILVGIGSVDDKDPLQILRHRVLLMLLSLSMFVGGSLCVWTLLMDRMSGIYLELVFLDGFLNLGQSIFTLALFGINTKGLLLNVKRRLRRLVYGREEIVLPAWEDLDSEDRNVSTRFIKHHMEVCMEQLLHDINVGLRRHCAAFYGSELVTWLIEFGLAQTRQEAEKVGRHLLRGRVIRHVDDFIDFYDGKFVYTFLPENRRQRS